MTAPRRRRRRSGFPIVATLLGLVGVLAVAGWTLHRRGLLPLPWMQEVAASESSGLAPGEVVVPLSALAVPAYAKVTRDHLIRAVDLGMARQYLPEQRVEELELITDLSSIIGRVMARKKAAGYAFRDSDFLPEGTRPGLVGGIPAHMRGLRIESEAIRGIAGLLPGDRFDILSAQALDRTPGAAASIPFSGVFAAQARAEASAEGASRRAAVEVLVQSGVVVEPLSTRQVPVSSASLSQGLSVRTRPVQELVIAVRPEELAALMEALVVEAELTCAPRSGHPDDPAESLTPVPVRERPRWLGGSGVDGGLSLVDRIDGAERQIVPVPGRAGVERP